MKYKVLNAGQTLVQAHSQDEILSKIKLMLLTMMEGYLHLLVEEQRVAVKHDFGFLRHVIEYMKNNLNDFEDSPLLMIYYYSFLCFFEKNDDQYFLKVRKLFKSHFSTFPKVDKKNIYVTLQTFCLKKINAGTESYNKELLDISLEMLKFNVLSYKNKDFIELNFYRNIVILCNNNNAVGILKKFIPKYVNLVPPVSRNSLLAYSHAHLSFLEGNFERTLKYCNKVNFNELLTSTQDNLYFKNDIKKLILQSFYDLKHFESALSLVDSYKHFVKNSKLIRERMKKDILNYLNFTNELIKLNLKFDEYNLSKLKSKFSVTKELMGRNWIKEKIEELSIEH